MLNLTNALPSPEATAHCYYDDLRQLRRHAGHRAIAQYRATGQRLGGYPSALTRGVP